MAALCGARGAAIRGARCAAAGAARGAAAGVARQRPPMGPAVRPVMRPVVWPVVRLTRRLPPTARTGELPRRSPISGDRAAESLRGARGGGHSSSRGSAKLRYGPAGGRDAPNNQVHGGDQRRPGGASRPPLRRRQPHGRVGARRLPRRRPPARSPPRGPPRRGADRPLTYPLAGRPLVDTEAKGRPTAWRFLVSPNAATTRAEL